ncbi:MAG: DinB family protein [Anaerolineales bacterium]
MNKFFEDYLDRLGDTHEDCKIALDGLSQDALDCRPTPGMNSIGALIIHIIGAERYWFGDVVMKEPSGRNRDQEFQSHGLDSLELTRRLDDALAYIQNSLETLSPADLTENRISPRDGEVFTIGWSMLHVLKHNALHLGHIEATRHMWEMGDYGP